MDPNATLEQIREAAETLRRAADHEDGYAEGMDDDGVDGLLAFCDVGAELAGLVSALDEWIAGGGFLPSSWAAAAGGLTADELEERGIDASANPELVRHGPNQCTECGQVLLSTLQAEEAERERLAEYPSRRPGGDLP